MRSAGHVTADVVQGRHVGGRIQVGGWRRRRGRRWRISRWWRRQLRLVVRCAGTSLFVVATSTHVALKNGILKTGGKKRVACHQFIFRSLHMCRHLPSRIPAGCLWRMQMIRRHGSVAIQHGRGSVTPVTYIVFDILDTKQRVKHKKETQK